MKNKDIRSVAIRLLSLREHSRQELTDKLRMRGFDLQAIEPLCDELASKGYLDDSRVAEAFLAAALLRQEKGGMRLRQELKRRGLSSDLVDATIARYRDQVNETEAARRLAELLLARGRERKYVERYLWRQGFTAAQVRAALNLDNELIDS